MLDDRLQPWTPGSDSALAFWVRSMAYTSLHMLFCLWVGVLCSLRASSQMKAAVWSLFVILIFALGPVFVYGFFGMFRLSANDVLLLLTVYPVGMWICCESRDLPGQDVELQCMGFGSGRCGQRASNCRGSVRAECECCRENPVAGFETRDGFLIMCHREFAS